MLVKGRAFRSFQISQKVRIVRKTRSLIFFFGIETHQSFVTLLEKGLVVECAPQSGVALVSSGASRGAPLLGLPVAHHGCAPANH
jgi:hypothetical protein